MVDNVFIHPSAISETDRIGDGTRIWAFAHILKGAQIGRDCNIGDHVYVENGAVIGNSVTVKNGVSVWEGVTLEDGVFVGPNVCFTNDRYPRSPRHVETRKRYETKQWLVPTLVREGATIGANATILCGVNIGRFAMIAAGAVVVRDVADFCLVAGCPARQTGHVCVCGEPLQEESNWQCNVCGRRYRREQSLLVLECE